MQSSASRVPRVFLLILTIFIIPICAQAQATRPATQHTMQFKAVNAKTGQPVAGVSGSYLLDEQTASDSRPYATDEKGEFVFPIAPASRSLRFSYRKDGFVEGYLILGDQTGGGTIPTSHILSLQPGLPIGGIVQDEQGKPVQGVKVQLTFQFPDADRSGGRGMSYGRAETDANGRWAFGGAPAAPTRVQIFAAHRDFVMRSFHHTLGAGQFDSLRQKSLVTKIQRGVTVSGTVADEQGKPLAGAAVAPDGFGLISAPQADETGRFELHGVEAGKRQLAARAEGYAPQLVDIDAKADMQPLSIRLEKGKTIRGRVLDSRGKPVGGAVVFVEKWRTLSSLGIYVKTDAEGRFVLNGAPADEVTLVASQRGSSDRASVTTVAGEKEVVLTLPAAIVLRANVVDDQTGKPIEEFSVHISATRARPADGGQSPERGRSGWSADRAGADGRFEMNAPQQGETFQLRISAAGYLPEDSPVLEVREGVVQFDARLKKGGGMSGSVLTPDGKPAAGADVVLMEKGAATVEDGVLTDWAKTSNPSTTTEPSGRFMLPPRDKAIKLMLFHESGWNIVSRAPGEALSDLKLRAWCSVEGRLMKGGQPWPGQAVTLRPTTERGDGLFQRQYFRYTATTDPQGRFAFKRVVDGTPEVSIRLESPMADGRMSYSNSHGRRINPKPGEQITGLQIGGTGRPVIAHVIVSDELKAKGMIPVEATISLARPPGFIPPPNWDSMAPEQKQELRDRYETTGAYQRYLASAKEFTAPLRADGTVRFDDIPSGEYTLDVRVLRSDPADNVWRPKASASLKFVVDDMPGGRSDQATDIGSVTLAEVNHPEAGQPFPDFQPATFEDKRLKFSDYRGKYVLIDFWATWCGPCIAGFKHMERLHAAYANDPRLVIVGVSVDERPEEPAKYLEGRKLPWPQAFAGTSAWATFGIRAIPSVWLIGPDGTIIAKQIPGEELDEMLKKVLAAQP